RAGRGRTAGRDTEATATEVSHLAGLEAARPGELDPVRHLRPDEAAVAPVGALAREQALEAHAADALGVVEGNVEVLLLAAEQLVLVDHVEQVAHRSSVYCDVTPSL